MNWTEVTIETRSEGVELLCALLTDLGFKGFAIHDPADFEDLMAGRVGHWDYLEEGLADALTAGEPSITVYVPENAQGAEQMLALRDELQRLRNESADTFGTLIMTSKGIREEDWANNWKQYFQPLCVGDRLWITPTWVDAQVPEGRVALRIDPGSSFGTGQHDTTRLCLAMLEGCVTEGCRVLDMGCGSGILGIAASLLGAKFISAVDIDENSARIAAENFKENNIAGEKFNVMAGNILNDQKFYDKVTAQKYDLIAANIVADVLIWMAPVFKKVLSDDGYLLVSGIISERSDEVVDALEQNGLCVKEFAESQEWAAVVLCHASL